MEEEKERPHQSAMLSLEDRWQRARDDMHSYPYVWASYIVVFGGLGLYTAHRWRALRKVEDELLRFQGRLKQTMTAKEESGSLKLSPLKPSKLEDPDSRASEGGLLLGLLQRVENLEREISELKGRPIPKRVVVKDKKMGELESPKVLKKRSYSKTDAAPWLVSEALAFHASGGTYEKFARKKALYRKSDAVRQEILNLFKLVRST